MARGMIARILERHGIEPANGGDCGYGKVWPNSKKHCVIGNHGKAKAILGRVMRGKLPPEAEPCELILRHRQIPPELWRTAKPPDPCRCGGTTWQGHAAMRISVANWITTDEDIERSLTAILDARRAASR
jgi:hypothetical protein